MRGPSHCIAGLALGACAVASPAAPVLHTNAVAAAGHWYAVGQTQTDIDTATSGTVTSSAQASWSGFDNSNLSSAGTGSASATAQFGRLGIYAHGQWLGGTGIGNGSASASFEDVWTIESPGLTGTRSTLYVTVSVDGTRVADWPYTGVNVLQGYECLASGSGCRLDFSDGGGEGTFGFGVEFTFGVPFTYILSMAGNTAADLYHPVGTVDFLHTAQISAFTVRDSTGAVVDGFSLTAASGHDYLGAHAIPEPAIWTLLLPVGVWFAAPRFRLMRHLARATGPGGHPRSAG